MRVTLAETGADASGENGLNGPLRFAQPPLQTLFSPRLPQEPSLVAAHQSSLKVFDSKLSILAWSAPGA